MRPWADPRFRFIALALGLSACLFALWPGVSAVYRALVSWAGSGLRYLAGADAIDLLGEKDSYALIPLIAVIAAAQGHPLRRKVAYVGVGVGLFLVVGTLTVAFDLVSGPRSGAGRHAGDLVFALLDVAVPVAVLVFFTGEDPSLLWTRGPRADKVVGRCPLCSVKQNDLALHVRSVHGRSALADPRVRRRLGPSDG